MERTKNKSKIKDYMDGVRVYLSQQYGEVKKEWEITLIMLEDSLYLYEQIKQTIATTGIYNNVRGVKNPLLSTLKDVQATILKLSQKLGISPWDSSKIHNTELDDTNDFLDALTGTDNQE